MGMISFAFFLSNICSCGCYTIYPDNSCSLESVRQPWDAVEMPWIIYSDLTCPSESGVVDDSAIWNARLDGKLLAARNESVRSLSATHFANKTLGGLQRPLGLMAAGGELLWVEQDAGELRSCAMQANGGCESAPTVLLEELNCPQDFAVDFSRGHIFVMQYGGGEGEEAQQSCGGEGRITRFALVPAADGSSLPLDIVTALVAPRFLALDPLSSDATGAGTYSHGLIFWTDPGHLGGSVMRANLDGTDVHQVFHLAEPSGVAVDVSRQALYATSQIRGASLVWSNYGGSRQKHVTRDLVRASPAPHVQLRLTRVQPRALPVPLSSHRHPVSPAQLYEPRGLAVDPTDGSVAVVEFDTFVAGCDPLYGGGYGAVSCAERNLGRISRISCAWTADSTVDGRPPGPFQCCCVEPDFNPWGCTLTCPDTAPPAQPPVPPSPPPVPPGMARYNVSEAIVPAVLRDYRKMIIDDETLLFVGGYVTTGTQAISWGDPTTVNLVTAARSAPPPPPGFWPNPAAGTLTYGRCAAGCGRPSGVDDCRACGSGFYGTGDGICRLCPVGTYGNFSRSPSLALACAPCPAGFYAPSAGSRSCSRCPIGAFCADGFEVSSYGILGNAPLQNAIPLPTLCPVGTYNPSTGSTSPTACIACPAGTRQPGTGATSPEQCLVCGAGSASRSQSSYCAPCTPSTAQPRDGQEECEECALGTYSNTDGAAQCSPCPTGSFGPQVGGANPLCDACAPGKYADTPGNWQCALCPNGTASSATRATSNETCVPCAEGFYAAFEGQTSCTSCPNATSSDDPLQPGAGMAVSPLAMLPDIALEVCVELLDSAAPRRAGERASTLVALLTIGAGAVLWTSASTARSTSSSTRSRLLP